MLLQIVIPVYNEADNIAGTLGEIAAKVSVPHTIQIVYDFDEDSTLPAARRYIETHGAGNISLVKNAYGPGALNAIRTGLDRCREGAALVVMADGSDDIGIVDAMFSKLNEGYDLVCGSRYMKGGRQPGGPLIKKMMTWTAGISLHLLTGIPTHDVSNSFKMYRVSLLRQISIESRGGFEVGMEILVKAFAGGGRITELPVTWRARRSGQSRFQTMKWLPGYLRWYWYALRHSRFKRSA